MGRILNVASTAAFQPAGPFMASYYARKGAQRDLEDIRRYVAESASIARADSALDRLLETVYSLSAYAERESIPRELRSLGVQAYCEQVVGP